MKSKILKTSIGSIIFLLLVIGVIASVFPLYQKINAFMTLEISNLAKLTDEKLGIEISYEELSPSVLSGIKLKNVNLRDSLTKKQLVKINRATFSYKISDFFSKKPLNAIHLLLLDGVKIEYDAVKDNDFVENLRQISGSQNGEQKKGSKKFTLSGRTFDIPFNVQLKNISIHYSDEKNDVLAFIKNILFEKTPTVQNGLQIKTSGRIEFKTELLKSQNSRSLIGCFFELSGNFFPDFEGSSFLLKLSEASRADYSVSKIELLLNYSNSKLALRTMRNLLPFSLLAEADFERQTLSLNTTGQNFEPLKLVKIKNGKTLYKKFEGTKLSGTLKADTSFASAESLVDSLNLYVNGQCFLTKNIIGSPLVLSYNAFCKDKNINVKEVRAEGEKLGFDLNGEFNLKTRQPSFVFTLDHFVLANGGVMQTELFVEPYKNGFMGFAPQFFLDDKSFTALELTVLPSSRSVDFTFEADDYSHAEYEKSAHVMIDGSFMNDSSKVLQASVSVSDMFLDSVLNAAAFFLPEQKSARLKKAADSVSSYIFSDEVYLTTDFKSFSFNSPYFLLANTKKDRELLTFALDGSSQTVSLSSLDLQYGSNSAHASAGIDFSESLTDFNFYTDFTVNSMPYSLRGSVSKDFINIAGDYNFNTTVSLGKEVSGSVEFASLPVSIGKTVLSTSVNTNFSWNNADGINFEIHNFDIDEPYGSLRLHPHFAFTGSANKYGFVMSKLAYSDTASALDGKMNLVWSFNDGILDSLRMELSADSILGTEKIRLNTELRNLEHKALTLENIKNDFYLDAQGSISAFPSARLMSDQNSENTLNADFSVSGTPLNPFFSLNLNRSSVNLAGYPCTFDGFVVYDDTGLSVSAGEAKWSKMEVSDFKASFNPKEFSGELSALLKGGALDLDFNIPLKADIHSLTPGKNPASNFIASISSDNMTGTFFPTPQSLNLIFTKTADRIDFTSGNGRDFTGSITAGQFISVSAGGELPLKFDLTGSIFHNQLDLSIKNLSADMKKFCQAYTIPYVNFTGGTLAGAVRITGLTTDPEYTGVVNILKPEVHIPLVSDKVFKADKVVAMAGQGHLIVKQTPFTVEKNSVNVGLDIEFDRWKINYLDCPINSDEGQFIYVDMTMPLVRYKGYGAFKDFLIHVTMDDVTFSGKIFGERGDIQISADSIQKSQEPVYSSMDYIVDLELQVKNKVQILVNPVLRGVIEPDNLLKLQINTGTGDFSAKGEIALRGGEIVWLNRSFYMKEGKVFFNETKELFDPRITVRAETRERDEDNNQVTITLSATRQALSKFNPRFTASPAKSETEIMELLGQVISGNSENVASLAMAGGDYLVQATVMRSLENSLRELLNFDIFSIRTNILQNAVKKSFEKNSTVTNLSFSNFFDNSAVYVGKYFGSAMYVDALMHWSYDENKKNDDTTVNGLIFQPEFGFEMSSPFVNIRLGVAPDLEAIKNSLWIPSTSITLSWKHTF